MARVSTQHGGAGACQYFSLRQPERPVSGTWGTSRLLGAGADGALERLTDGSATAGGGVPSGLALQRTCQRDGLPGRWRLEKERSRRAGVRGTSVRELSESGRVQRGCKR